MLGVEINKMTVMRKFFFIMCCLLFSTRILAEDQGIAKLFVQNQMKGTMLITSLHSGQTFIHNDSRVNRRFSAASTFKILNTLIALKAGAISGKDDRLKWNGHHYDLADWNHDHTLESAFKASCVWCFQELARRVGIAKYRNYLHQLAYGELHEPFEVTTFWLDGSLKISAKEQVEFLKKIYQRSLPFSMSFYETLQQIMLVEQTPTFTIRAKTGWATTEKPAVGWYVGYVETSNDVWFFATNLEIRNKKELPMRQQLTRQALQEKGIVE